MAIELGQRMRASLLTAREAIGIEDVEIPQLDRDQVLVGIAAVGVCGSDVHYYREGKLGDSAVTSPVILGHEASGVIVR